MSEQLDWNGTEKLSVEEMAANIAGALNANQIRYEAHHDIEAGALGFDILGGDGVPALHYGPHRDFGGTWLLRRNTTAQYDAMWADGHRGDDFPRRVAELLDEAIMKAGKRALWRAEMDADGETGRQPARQQERSEDEPLGIRAKRLGFHPKRLERMDKIENEYIQHGWTQREMAKDADVAERTIRKDIGDMKARPDEFPKTARCFPS